MELTNKDNVLMICEKQYKEKLLQSLYSEKVISDITFMSLNEYKKAYFFDYGIDAIRYLMTKGLSYSNCKEIIENLYYIEDKNYGDDTRHRNCPVWLFDFAGHKSNCNNRAIRKYSCWHHRNKAEIARIPAAKER